MIGRRRGRRPRRAAANDQLRICIAYDRLYPDSVGGAERWYRLLAERLADDGHAVTYLTGQQWPDERPPSIPGVQIVACQPPSALYDTRRRRTGPVFGFAWGVLRHLLRHGRMYDVVQTSAMASPTALVVAWLSRPLGYRAILDWWEVWRLGYWRAYLGTGKGLAGWLAQGVLANAPHHPLAYSALHAGRLRQFRRRNDVTIVRGLLPADRAIAAPRAAEPVLVYLGRHIPEKQIVAIPPALALARGRIPGLRARIFGHGPDTEAIQEVIRAAGVGDLVDLPGFVPEAEVTAALDRALCLLLLSRREGYGLVVAEAAARGVPSIVLDHPDSAARELIVDGVNGVLCTTTEPEEVASAILRIHEAGDDLRRSTLAWFQASAGALTIDGAMPRLLDVYRGAAEGSRQ
ncbi:MAG: glycosyltransferase [Thermomicrobiales bacterium]|nr:glycosyltransferase [Thermomicrobiales bacterium]